MFSDIDLQQIALRGSNTRDVDTQIQNFKDGFPFMQLEKAATPTHGIKQMSEEELKSFSKYYDENIGRKSVVKFVPASGAASRMFKSLFEFMDSYQGTEEEYEKLKADQGKNSIFTFFKKIEKFAFYKDLKAALAKNDINLEEAVLKREYRQVLKGLLTEDGLDYGNLPKGLLKFHNYEDGARVPVEEHLVEGANYAKSSEGDVKIHFTVSPEHEKKFFEKVEEVKSKYEKAFGVRFDISYSQQKASTDTIAVGLDNEPFRLDNGSLLFRPGGHGALLANLDEINADLIFIKNIDNVVPDNIKADTFLYKKIIGGVLLDLQQKAFAYLTKMEGQEVSEAELAEMESFLEKELCVLPGTAVGGKDKDSRVAYVKNKLNRPIRVCGMVKNEGEPGGGPFWAKNPDGSVSLQVVESAQVDMGNEEQASILKNSTHFNPVDLVCGVKDYMGGEFKLLKYRDPKTGFISQKSKDGKDLKAQELPGLWNGAMSDWNTVFVEVPIITFNPVKVVNDLLRDEHQ
ncbi:DUF4301 family protein [Flammeovirgaceae bacterium SG7u.111]|nr:DUF4301 family protein [Flammeovirgaceae bacterium SG7u.132]WPO35989.1 DUF4301 family protein [Flammeovirgaceae bacterium SG7u.111]